MKIGFRTKELFFDRPRVLAAVDRATRRGLMRFGGYVRRVARNSMKSGGKKEKPSRPGEPPHYHTRILKDRLFFAYDPMHNSVVIGPEKTNQVFFDRHRQPVKGTVPEVLEYGGEITILEVQKYGRWRRADLRSKRRNASLPQRYRTVKIAARPYMGPAFAKGKDKGLDSWADSLKAAA